MDISNGNKKIGNDTLIINFTPATTCPSKQLGLCKVCSICYAMKAERMYKQVLPYRQRQEVYWDNTPVVTIAKDLQQEIALRHGRIKYIRFSEAGDFKDQTSLDKLKMLAELIKDLGVTVYGYTARKDLDFSNLPENLVINGSSFMVSNSFTAVKQPGPTDIVCPGNCRECSMCKSSKGLDIKVKVH